jgi:uncharacterized protein (TIGR01319 family)
MTLVSIDIGSTWTKGVNLAFSAQGQLELVASAAHQTTVDNLSRGFNAVFETLAADGYANEIFYSSSAKGGLAVAAVGIVPEITAEMARITAHSAGAKLTQSFAYELRNADIAALRMSEPDIILLAGGSDGGNAHYPVENAKRLAHAALSSTIVYAGNSHVRDDVEQILAGYDLICVDNLLPALDCPNPEPARRAIRELFLGKITTGKGLDEIVRATGHKPCPTPYALYEYCRYISELAPEFGEFLLIDMGGATTDVYSYHEEINLLGTVRRGLPEPKIKRTVEGDLGMRVSARAAAEARRALLAPCEGAEDAEFDRYVDKVTMAPETLPCSRMEMHYDALLAHANIATSLMRHAGRAHEVCTADGIVTMQTGRDLTRVSQIIGTGGYLANAVDFNPHDSISRLGVDAQGKRILAPRGGQYHRDPDYLFPLLANIARGHAAEAVKKGLQVLTANP